MPTFPQSFAPQTPLVTLITLWELNGHLQQEIELSRQQSRNLQRDHASFRAETLT